MTESDLLGFLKPDFSDGIQAIFVPALALLALVTAAVQVFFVKKSLWERKWKKEGGVSEARLDIDHGSAMEIYHAMATRPELLKDIMPGMLLVIGLLGTFLGLGLALNSASSALQSSGEGLGAMSGDMMAMLQGLGAKFKTSTWGIIGYIFLKVVDQMAQTDEKRMMWVIEKVDLEMTQRKEQSLKEQESKRLALLDSIDAAASKVACCLEDMSSSVAINNGKLFASLEAALERGFLDMRAEANARKEALLASIEKVAGSTEKNGALIESGLLSVREESEKVSVAMVDFVANVNSTIERMADAAAGISEGSDKISGSAAGLAKVVEDFGSQFEAVLVDVRKDLGSAINDMSNNAAKTLSEGSEKLGAATQEISSALAVLSEDIKSTLDQVQVSIDESKKQQSRAMALFSTTAETLNVNVEQATQNAIGVQEAITRGLKSVADSGMQMKLIGEKLEQQTGSIDKFGYSNAEVAKELQNVAHALGELPEKIAGGDFKEGQAKGVGAFLEELTGKRGE